jgi:hypothetical protein
VRTMLCCLTVAVSIAAVPPAATAQRAPATGRHGAADAPAVATRTVYLDRDGVIRWRDDRSEVALFGANYVLPTASDYRAAGYLHADRKRMIDEDMAQFARMGWDGLRLAWWGDWEAADSAGNLIANDHLDLLDYLIARARERGIYMLLSPIELYSSNWPDAMQRDPEMPGFGRVFGKQRMGTDPAAIAAQVNYLRQLLEHVNPYTGVALKDEPAIPFIELVNEPWHHPEDLEGSIHYLNALSDAIRGTGCTKVVFHNVSQDFRIAEAIRRSRVQGVTFHQYPTGLVAGHALEGNYLRTVDDYPDMRRPELTGMPRIVYEFDTADLLSGTMYPAIIRNFRGAGAQFVAMFAYDFLATASRNLGWQTHHLNLVYTPQKAVSAVIAAEAMRRLPRMRSYGPYPTNTTFGDFHVSADSDLGELVARDAFLYDGTTRTAPPDAAALRRIAGVGSSPVVAYGGVGTYFLDKVRDGVWRLEVYPDAVPVRDPFEPPNPAKIVTRAIARAWPMTVTLPDLGAGFTVQRVGTTATAPAAGGAAAPVQLGAAERASEGGFTVIPGVYLLSAAGPVDPTTLPALAGRVGFAEYHAPPADTVPPVVVPLTPPEVLTGGAVELRARIVDTTPPDSATLYLRPAAGGFYRAFPMRPAEGYVYSATVPAGALREGSYAFVVTLFRGGAALTLPGGLALRPTDWDYYGADAWRVDAVGARTPLLLFAPGADAGRLVFSRIGDAGRQGLFRIGFSAATGRPVFHLELPARAGGPDGDDYTASLVVRDRVRARGAAIGAADSVRIRLRGLGPRQVLHVTLMEDDGTSWTAPVAVDSSWIERSVPLAAFTAGRGVLLPEGFPGEWNYWVAPAAGRGGAGDRPRFEHVERLQLSLRREGGAAPAPGMYGVEVEWVTLGFGGGGPGR